MRLLKFKGLEINPSKVSESITVRPNVLVENKTAIQEADGGVKHLLPRIEAIHAGTTRNHTRYPADKLRGDALLKSGVYSWTHPYPKPVIFNHDTETEVTGRVHNATFAEMTSAGKPGIIVIPRITDPVAIEKILDGRLLTVSIGATTDAAICTICGTDIIDEGFCGHWRGEVYDGITTEWIVGNTYFDELSWVNVPADQDAMVVDAGVSTAEAYAESGKGIINLGKNPTEWRVDKKIAVSEGLVADGQKGDNTLTIEEQLKAAQALAETLQGQVTTLTEENTDLKAKLQTAEQTVETKDQELTAKAEELQAKTEELEAKATEAEEATTAKTEADAQVAELTQTVESLETEKTTLLETNATLSTEMHKSVAERVVDLKVSLGKVANREEAVEQHVARSTESLKDSLSDLLTEAAAKPVTRAPAVDNPAGGALTDGLEPNATIEGAVKGEKPMDTATALKSLFGGPAFNTKKK